MTGVANQMGGLRIGLLVFAWKNENETKDEQNMDANKHMFELLLTNGMVTVAEQSGDDEIPIRKAYLLRKSKMGALRWTHYLS